MAEKKPGLGKKLCPHCNKIIGARSTTCPECGKAIEPKAKKKKSGASDVRKQLEAVKEAGGLTALKKAIDATEKAEEALSAFGGLDGAKSAVALVEELKAL